jgi:hypothetical protein
MRTRRTRGARRLRASAGFATATLLLLLGVTVLVGAVIWLALDRAIQSVMAPAFPEAATATQFRLVKGSGERDGAASDTMVWLTSTALEDCAQVRDGRNRDVTRKLKDLVSSASASRDSKEEDACAPFQLGRVAAGTRVEVLGECGEMARIKVSSGRLQGQQGCIETDRLENLPARSQQSPAASQSQR